MTYQTDCTLPDELLEQIADQVRDVLPELIRRLIQLRKLYQLRKNRQNYKEPTPVKRLALLTDRFVGLAK